MDLLSKRTIIFMSDISRLSTPYEELDLDLLQDILSLCEKVDAGDKENENDNHEFEILFKSVKKAHYEKTRESYRKRVSISSERDHSIVCLETTNESFPFLLIDCYLEYPHCSFVLLQENKQTDNDFIYSSFISWKMKRKNYRDVSTFCRSIKQEKLKEWIKTFTLDHHYGLILSKSYPPFIRQWQEILKEELSC